jgi:polyhydroxybutyrate depolymerase
VLYKIAIRVFALAVTAFGCSSSGPSGAAGAGGGAARGAIGGAAGAGGLARSGCGVAPPAVGPSNPQTINVTDNTGATIPRQFYVSVPSNYDPSRPYRLIFAWHYYSGSASGLAAIDSGGAPDAATTTGPPPVPGYYGVQPLLPDAIYVAGQGLSTTPGDATTSSWTNANDEDIAFTKSMIAWIESNFCVDSARILSVGMSVGGYMSNTVGCEMPDVFRAIAVMSGAAPGSACKSHDIAAWMTHGTADTTISISSDETARDQFLADNYCGATMEPVDPSPCVSYDGCDSGYPVVWCPVEGEGHAIPTFAAGGIATFFSQF